MQYFQCGKVQIPLVLCSGMSWTRTARTVKRRGGYETALGFEAVEVSIRAIYDYGIIKECGLDPVELYRDLSMLVTECTDNPDRLVVGGFEPLHSLLFALISCNKTQVYDSAFSPSMELDLVFAGVRCKKEVSRNLVLSDERSGEMPSLRLKKGEKIIDLKDSYSITQCIQRENSVSIAFLVRDDMTLIEREFINLTDGACKVVFNGREYAIVSCQIDDNLVQIEGSFWPIAAQRPFVRTYRDTDLSTIIKDIAREAGVEIDCRIKGDVEYYLNSLSPMEAIAAIVESCGALSYWRGGKLLICDVPDVVQAGTTLEAEVSASDGQTEPLTACVWSDGIISKTAGDAKGTGIIIQSVYHGESKENACLKRGKFSQHEIVCNAPAREDVEAGSAFMISIENSVINALIRSFECDWITGQGMYTLNYL